MAHLEVTGQNACRKPHGKIKPQLATSCQPRVASLIPFAAKIGWRKPWGRGRFTRMLRLRR